MDEKNILEINGELSQIGEIKSMSICQKQYGLKEIPRL